MCKSPPPPPPPDPTAVSAAQTGSNVNTAVANSIIGNANTVDPYGSTTFNQIGSTDVGGNQVPQWEKTTTLAPAQQQMLDLQNQTGINLQQTALDQSGQIGTLLAHPVTAEGLPDYAGAPQAPSFNGLPGGPQLQVPQLQGQGDPTLPITGNVPVGQQATSFGQGGPIQGSVQQTNFDPNFGQTSGHIVNSVGPQDFSADRDAVTQAYLDRMNPQLDRDRSALENQLVNQGFARGTTAFNTQMDQANRQANDARQQAILAGGQEQSRLAGLQLNQANFANQAQAQDYGQQQGRGLFGLQAGQAQNAANINTGTFANTAQNQQFGQNQAQGQFGNAAVQGNNSANLAGGQFQNSAAGQAFAQQQAQQAFNNAVAQGNAQGANDAATAAYNSAVAQAQQGNTNAQQGFSNNTANAQLNNQVRAQALQERLGLQQAPINEISALMSGGQIQAPQTVQYQGGSIQPTNVSGNTYNSAALAQQNYQSEVAQQNAGMGGLFGLGSAAINGIAKNPAVLAGMFSDRRLKRDIVDTGIRLLNGLKLYSFRYLWSAARHIGVMAEDVKKIRPDAVFSVGGYDVVNYGMAMEAI